VREKEREREKVKMVFASTADYVRALNSNPKTSDIYQETLRKLWKDKTFTGSYSGLNNFLRSVKFDLGAVYTCLFQQIF
jgi:hypothetical protein